METPKLLAVRVRQRLDEADWRSIYPKLVLHAKQLARSLFWRSGNKADLAQGLNPEDLVNEAIKRVYEGRREWDPDKHPDLLRFLKGSVLDSLFNELATSADNTQLDRFPDKSDQHGIVQEPDGQTLPRATHAQYLMRENPNPEELLIAHKASQEQERLAKEITNRLLELAKDDKEVTAILECTMEGLTVPREIAKRMAIAVEKIYNAQKRFRLMMKKVSSEYPDLMSLERSI